jgi:hypothetical protein
MPYQDSLGGGFQSSEGFIGSMDEVRIWKTVRTHDEIKASMDRLAEATLVC